MTIQIVIEPSTTCSEARIVNTSVFRNICKSAIPIVSEEAISIYNLASMCQPCHRNLHTRGHKIHTPLNGRPRLQSPEPRDTESFSQPPTDAAATARSP